MGKYRDRKLRSEGVMRPVPKWVQDSATDAVLKLRLEQTQRALLYLILDGLMKPGTSAPDPAVVARALSDKPGDLDQLVQDVFWLLPNNVRVTVRNELALRCCHNCGAKLAPGEGCSCEVYGDDSDLFESEADYDIPETP